MANELDDGTVIPSFMGVQNRASYSIGAGLTMSDSSLRLGEVLACYAATDPLNVSGKENEYIVLTNHRNGSGELVPAPYRCTLSDGFGAAGDHYRRSLRARGQPPDQGSVGNGAWVLLACINGDKAHAVILSCLRNQNRTDQDPAGRFLSFEFNGVTVDIGDDGSMKLQVKGSTGIDGSLDSDGDPTIITVTSDRKVTIDTGDVTVNSDSATVNSDDVAVNATKVDVEADIVNVKSEDVNLGDSLLTPNQGVVTGEGVDTFTGTPYAALGNASLTVKAKKG